MELTFTKFCSIYGNKNTWIYSSVFCFLRFNWIKSKKWLHLVYKNIFKAYNKQCKLLNWSARYVN